MVGPSPEPQLIQSRVAEWTTTTAKMDAIVARTVTDNVLVKDRTPKIIETAVDLTRSAHSALPPLPAKVRASTAPRQMDLEDDARLLQVEASVPPIPTSKTLNLDMTVIPPRSRNLRVAKPSIDYYQWPSLY